MSPLARGMRAVVRLYQLARAGRPSPCRYLPSCSEYAAEALEVHGAVRGSWLSLRRICRCNPWGGHGFDPVPALGTRSHHFHPVDGVAEIIHERPVA